MDIVFDEPVTGLTLSGINVDNGTASALSGSGTAYTATITPDTDGTVTISLLAGNAFDLAGNGNVASNVFSVYDATNPQATITTTVLDPINTPLQ